MFGIEERDGTLTVYINGRPVIRHSEDKPFLTVGKPEKSGACKPVALTSAFYEEERSCLRFSGGGYAVTFSLSDQGGCLVMAGQKCQPNIGFMRMDFPASGDARLFGGGELRRSERLKNRRYDLRVRAGAPQHACGLISSLFAGLGFSGESRYPQTSFITGEMTLYHIDTKCGCTFDFSDRSRCRAEIRGMPERIVIAAENKPSGALKHLSELSGMQPPPPQWCAEGVWMDVRGGAQALEDCLSKAVSVGLKVACVVLRDWSGHMETAGGCMPFWDWTPSPELYPEAGRMITGLRERGIRALACVNPCLSIEGRFFAEGSGQGYLVRRADGGAHISDLGGVMAGHLDLTNPKALEWYREVIRENVLKKGFSGYMADMDGFLPSGGEFFDRSELQSARNRWPVLWAKLNREVMDGMPNGRELVLVVDSGFSGAAAYAPLALTGARRAVWGAYGGLRSAFNASLSLGWSGYGASYSMTGGMHRGFLRLDGRELLMRWAEFSAFTPVMHAAFGGGPRVACVDEDVETLRHFARMAAVHERLSPYLNACAAEHAKTGIPVMRPLDMAFYPEKQPADAPGEYMLGPDLLVAPVLSRGKRERSVVFPKGKWVCLWSGREYAEGRAQVPAPFGKPPVFFPSGSRYADFFLSLKTERNP